MPSNLEEKFLQRENGQNLLFLVRWTHNRRRREREGWLGDGGDKSLAIYGRKVFVIRPGGERGNSRVLVLVLVASKQASISSRFPPTRRKECMCVYVIYLSPPPEVESCSQITPLTPTLSLSAPDEARAENTFPYSAFPLSSPPPLLTPQGRKQGPSSTYLVRILYTLTYSPNLPTKRNIMAYV